MAAKAIRTKSTRSKMICFVITALIFGLAIYALWVFSYTGAIQDGEAAIKLKKESYPVGVTEVTGKWVLSAEHRAINEDNGWEYTPNNGVFFIEKYDNDGWRRYGAEQVGFPQPLAQPIEHGTIITFEICPIYVDEGLPEGEYRIIKPIYLCDKKTFKAVGEETDIYCYFSVK